MGEELTVEVETTTVHTTSGTMNILHSHYML